MLESAGKKNILSLCDASGNWPRAYAEDPAYEVWQFDTKFGPDFDVRLLPHLGVPIHGLLMAPPCTHFAVGGAASWKHKTNKHLREGLEVVRACLSLVTIYKPKWWALENPAGRLTRWLGPWDWTFQPFEYGGWLLPGEKTVPDCRLFPANDGYTKRTCIWSGGTARKPEPRPVPLSRPFAGQPRIARGNRWNNPCFRVHEEHRSITPLGFARAFKAANP